MSGNGIGDWVNLDQPQAIVPPPGQQQAQGQVFQQPLAPQQQQYAVVPDAQSARLPPGYMADPTWQPPSGPMHGMGAGPAPPKKFGWGVVVGAAVLGFVATKFIPKSLGGSK